MHRLTGGGREEERDGLEERGKQLWKPIGKTAQLFCSTSELVLAL